MNASSYFLQYIYAMKKNIADFTDKTINEIKLIVPKPYWAVEEYISLFCQKIYYRIKVGSKYFLSKQHPLFNMANLAK